MFQWALKIGTLAALMGATACQSPDDATCRNACTNVVRALASEMQGLDDAAREALAMEADESLDGCVESCRSQSASHVECLANARTSKAVSECLGQGL
jgi:hypothetical protein